jgi:hypothetical protein
LFKHLPSVADCRLAAAGDVKLCEVGVENPIK